MSTPKSEATKERILRAAERLFAARGVDGVSMREIAAAAEVQLALISYHFRTKLDLYRAVFRRRFDPIANERLSRLREVMGRGDPPATIEEVLDALARPWVEFRDRRGGQSYARLIAREVSDPREASRGIVKEMLDPIAKEFIAAMEEVLPGHSKAQVHWAYHFFVGSLLLVLLQPERPKRLSGNLCNISDSEEVLAQIVGFFVSALRSRELSPVKRTGAKRKPSKGNGHEARHLYRAR